MLYFVLFGVLSLTGLILYHNSKDPWKNWEDSEEFPARLDDKVTTSGDYLRNKSGI